MVITMHPATQAILKYFDYEHLHAPQRQVSVQFHELAHDLINLLPPNPETTVALRKLLESKDAAVRASLDEATHG